jgi:hypothetical protein
MKRKVIKRIKEEGNEVRNRMKEKEIEAREKR